MATRDAKCIAKKFAQMQFELGYSALKFVDREFRIQNEYLFLIILRKIQMCLIMLIHVFI